MKQTGIGAAFVIFASVMWGIMFMFTRPLTAAGLSAYTITFTRYATVVILFFLIFLVYDRSLFKIHKKDLWLFVLLGTFSLLVSNVTYCMAQQIMPMAVCSTMLYTYPCFVLILSAVFLKEGMSKQKVIALILAFFGCAMTSGVLGGVGNVDIFAVLLMLLSASSYAFYSVFGKFAIKKYDSKTICFYSALFVIVPLMPFSDLGGFVEIASTTDGVWFNTIMLGVFVTFLAYEFYTLGLQRLEAGKASILAYVEVLTSTVMGLIAFSEVPTMENIIGILCILFALVFLNINLRLDRFYTPKRNKKRSS